MKIYGTYREKRLTNPLKLEKGLSLNGNYTPSMFINNQFADYEAAGLTKILDGQNLIPDDKYTAELAPGIPKLTRFIMGEYNEQFVDPLEFEKSIKAVGAEFQIETFATVEEARQWIRESTSLVEETTGKFLVSEAYTDPVMPELSYEAKYLIIE